MKPLTLALSQLKPFSQWAASHGYAVEPPKGTEVLRLRREPAPPLRFTRALDRAQARGDAARLVAKWRTETRTPEAP